MILSENPRIEFTCEDNMCLMARYSDKHFELAIVDPPYGIGVNHNMGRRKGDKPSNYKPETWDKIPPSILYFNQLFNISKNQIVWGANHFIENMARNSSCWLLWDKGFNKKVSFAQFEMAYTSFKSTAKKFDKNPNLTERIHPTQKPVALYKWLLQNYAKEGDTILDTHVGSGSIMIACWELGFDFVGCELDKDYYEAAIKRFKEHVQAHPKLFTPKQLTNIQLTID